MTDRIAPDHWNGWHLDPNLPALIYVGEENPGYCVELDRMLTNDDIVYWVVQVGGKPWPGGLDGFVAAIDDLYDPHKEMNAMWRRDGEGRYTPESIRAAVATFAAEEVRHHSKWVSPAQAGVA